VAPEGSRGSTRRKAGLRRNPNVTASRTPRVNGHRGSDADPNFPLDISRARTARLDAGGGVTSITTASSSSRPRRSTVPRRTAGRRGLRHGSRVEPSAGRGQEHRHLTVLLGAARHRAGKTYYMAAPARAVTATTLTAQELRPATSFFTGLLSGTQDGGPTSRPATSGCSRRDSVTCQRHGHGPATCCIEPYGHANGNYQARSPARLAAASIPRIARTGNTAGHAQLQRAALVVPSSTPGPR